MVIIIQPKERDHRNISRLEVEYGNGKFETPTRSVTKNDINAKSRLGADTPLTEQRRVFVCQEHINSNIAFDVLNTNGFLGEFMAKQLAFLDRVKGTKAMTAMYPRITDELLRSMSSDSSLRNGISHFILQLMSELKSDVYFLQSEMLGEAEMRILQNQSTPFVPIFDIHHIQPIKDRLQEFIDMSSDMVPFIGFTHASYIHANLAFDYIMLNLESIHEQSKGIVSVDASRSLGKSGTDVSGPHYSSFLISDIVAEEYHGRIVPDEDSPLIPRVFEKSDLAIPPIMAGHNVAEHEDELAYFGDDQGLKDLFLRTLSYNNSEKDIKRNRPSYMSRLHEGLVSAKEYENMRAVIISHELKNYRESKYKMNQLLINQKL